MNGSPGVGLPSWGGPTLSVAAADASDGERQVAGRTTFEGVTCGGIRIDISPKLGFLHGSPDAHAGLYDGFHIAASSITMWACLAYDKDEGGRGRNQRYGTFVEAGKSRLNLQVSNGNDGSHDNLVGGIGGFLTGLKNRIVATGQDEFVTP